MNELILYYILFSLPQSNSRYQQMQIPEKKQKRIITEAFKENIYKNITIRKAFENQESSQHWEDHETTETRHSATITDKMGKNY